MSGQLENPQDPHNTEYLGNPPHLCLVARMLTLALNLVDVYLNVNVNVNVNVYQVIKENTLKLTRDTIKDIK